jgi:hypothetical protein
MDFFDGKIKVKKPQMHPLFAPKWSQISLNSTFQESLDASFFGRKTILNSTPIIP